MNKKFFLAALTLGTASLASIFSSAPAKAASEVSADVPIEVNIPPVIFLQTYDRLTFETTIQDLTGLASDGVIRAGNGTVTVSDGTVTPALTAGSTPAFTATKDVSGVLVYKTWGLGDVNEQINRQVSYNGADLTKGNSSIAVTVTGGDTVAAPGLDYANADDGNVDFTFDFTGVKAAGLHTGGVVTITATAE